MPLELIPAIDLKDGQCVRLRQGRMDDDTVFSSDPVAIAEQWWQQGTRRLHIVDLDGAFAGEPRNAGLIEQICSRLPELKVQIGGGIRSEAIAKHYIDAGVSWVIIGTQAVREPALVSALCKQHPGSVIVGLDARAGKVAVDGWAESSGVDVLELAAKFEDAGVSAIVYTDIEKDGMMQGFARESTLRLADAVEIPVIASGGVSSYDDIDYLCTVVDRGVSGAILGRAIYEGSIDFPLALQRVQQYGDGAS